MEFSLSIYHIGRYKVDLIVKNRDLRVKREARREKLEVLIPFKTIMLTLMKEIIEILYLYLFLMTHVQSCLVCYKPFN